MMMKSSSSPVWWTFIRLTDRRLIQILVFVAAIFSFTSTTFIHLADLEEEQQQQQHDEYGTDTTGTMSSSSSTTTDGVVESEPSPAVTAVQGLYLQSVMDQRKTGSSGGSGGWNLFRKVSGGGGGSDPDIDQTRIKTLEEQRAELERQVAELQSEVVKLQSHHKDELYTSQKTIERLQGDVDALTEQLKLNQALLTEQHQQQQAVRV
mmetsp:Transcript_2801/g.6148  ORF Transcript_2801/g.6148 Transcript_2801/m.6148 type:complete len:207 (-) Transcript_2801:86-706(-)